MKIYLAVDANNWCHKDYFGSGVEFVCKNFINRLADIESRFCHILIAFDGDRSFRHELFDQYKAGREEKPGLDAAMLELECTLGEKGYEVQKVDGLEADDLIARYVDLAVSDGANALIASSDKDMHQLLSNGRVSQMTSIRKRLPEVGGYECEFVTERALLAKYGVLPSQWVEYRMLTGDPSDKIPGCKGIGPKVAREVLAKCGSLQEFWKDPESWGFSKPKTAKLVEFRETSELFRKLMDLRLDDKLMVR